MGMYDDARNLIQRGAADLSPILCYFEKSSVARQMPTVGCYINNLVHYTTHRGNKRESLT